MRIARTDRRRRPGSACAVDQILEAQSDGIMSETVPSQLADVFSRKSRLTKYEVSRIIGIRTSQLSMSAPVMVEVPVRKQHNFVYIAALELQARALDIVIRRPLPMGQYYEINIKELELPDDVDTVVTMYE